MSRDVVFDDGTVIDMDEVERELHRKRRDDSEPLHTFPIPDECRSEDFDSNEGFDSPECKYALEKEIQHIVDEERE